MKTIVVKYGGSVFSEKERNRTLLTEILKLKDKNTVVLVHGGGKEVTNMLSRLKVPTRFIDGLRYTDEKTMEVVEMVLSGKVNKNIVMQINACGGRAVGISAKDACIVIGRRIRRLGLVGEPDLVDCSLLKTLLKSGFIPVVSSVGQDKHGVSLNFNADTLASTIAIGLQADKLVFLTDVPGVMDKNNNLIPQIKVADITRMIKEKVITGGMIPKLKSCVVSLNQGVEEIVITDGRNGLIQGGTHIVM